MATNITAPALTSACDVVASALRSMSAPDLGAPTPCTDFDVRALATHFAGTSSAFAQAGESGALDADDPWGSKVELADDWPEQIAGNLDAIGGGWSDPARWEGEIDNCPMPGAALGGMSLIEVVMHGWDVLRSAGAGLELPEDTAAELLSQVEVTASMGRDGGAYGPEVEVADDAGDLDKALGLTGRDPAWSA